MERDVFRFLARILRTLGRRRPSRRHRFTDATILEVYLWAVLCNQPVSWACRPEHWPRGLRRGCLPSQSAVSRRLRSPSALTLLARVFNACLEQGADARTPSAVCIIDGKALTIPLHSADTQAGKGRGVGQIALGYKLHAVVDDRGRLVAMRLASLNIDEREIARRMVPALPGHFKYLLADSFYDSRQLHIVCAAAGVQLLAPRRVPGGQLRPRRASPTRTLAVAAFETDAHPQLRAMHRKRYLIEHFFAQLTNATGGLQPPPWIRSFPTTKRWITAKIIFLHAKKALRSSLPHASFVA